MKFSNRSLAALEGIYRFVGGQRSVSEFDLASPIFAVHDVSQIAQRAAGFRLDGSLTIAEPLALTTAFGAAFTITGVLGGVADELTRRGLTPFDVDLWITHLFVHATANPTNVGSVAVGVTRVEAGTATDVVLGIFDTANSSLQAASPPQLTDSAGRNVDLRAGIPLPFLVRGAGSEAAAAIRARLSTGAGGGATVRCWFGMWVAPKGSEPQFDA